MTPQSHATNDEASACFGVRMGTLEKTPSMFSKGSVFARRDRPRQDLAVDLPSNGPRVAELICVSLNLNLKDES